MNFRKYRWYSGLTLNRVCSHYKTSRVEELSEAPRTRVVYRRLFVHASVVVFSSQNGMQTSERQQTGIGALGAYMSSSSSSNSPSSSAEASWYCWYSETRSFMLDSASVNSISSIPSPVYQ